MRFKSLVYAFISLPMKRLVTVGLTQQILRSFQDGQLRVLTAKRVLDEGVNIPQIQKAFILASTTVERQWVQRRGRLLRKCDEIDKNHGEIHDFVAVPSDLTDLDRDARSLVSSELAAGPKSSLGRRETLVCQVVPWR